ncbi:tripartite tricarboxylate transporter TctB family protein [Marinactinospora rubrisoli]|uniref:Tripartite tricarboxylate transporter TctB family protein n=1 Tax=Marinactinospora rubrisoli TaxID=2715399 RepID=A0ABW2KGZ4_9ACTN
MTTTEPKPTDSPRARRKAAAAAARTGRPPGGLAVPALAGATGACVLLGGAFMDVPAASGFLGPRFFPLAVGALLTVVALAATAQALWAARTRRVSSPAPEPPSTAALAEEAADPTGATSPERGDRRTLATMAATLVAHLLLLQPLGWLVSGTLLFWGISYAVDRRRPLLDLCVAATLAGLVQLLFSGLLDVTLPAGILGRVL